MTAMNAADPIWPDLSYTGWSDTLATFHLWTQIVGKIRLTLTPWLNHCWQAPRVRHRAGTHDVADSDRDRDLRDRLRLHRASPLRSDGGGRLESLPLRPQSVAAFYRALWSCSDGSASSHHPHDAERGRESDRLRPGREARVLRSRLRESVLARARPGDRVFQIFRARFLGKCSPVHFFWGASISRSRDSRDGAPRPIPAAFRTFPIA